MSSTPFLNPASSNLRKRFDQFGIGLAGLCALHCVASILIVTGLGVGGHYLFAPEIHEVGLALAVVIAGLAIGWGVWRHRRPAPAIIAVAGLSFMASALAVGHGSDEAMLTIIGVGLVSVGHLMNLRGFR